MYDVEVGFLFLPAPPTFVTSLSSGKIVCLNHMFSLTNTFLQMDRDNKDVHPSIHLLYPVKGPS